MTNDELRARDVRTLRDGEEPPACYGCKGASEYVSDTITPAGYHSYFCERCVPKRPERLWGSDPGWTVNYITIDEARLRYPATAVPR